MILSLCNYPSFSRTPLQVTYFYQVSWKVSWLVPEAGPIAGLSFSWEFDRPGSKGRREILSTRSEGGERERDEAATFQGLSPKKGGRRGGFGKQNHSGMALRPSGLL